MSAANVSQNPAAARLTSARVATGQRMGRAWGGVGVGMDVADLLHLVLYECIERNVDGKGDEGEKRREEREERGDQLQGDVRADRRKEREEGNAGRCDHQVSRQGSGELLMQW